MKYLVEFCGPHDGDEARVIVQADSPDDALPLARRLVRKLAANRELPYLLGRRIDPVEFDSWRVDVVHAAD